MSTVGLFWQRSEKYQNLQHVVCRIQTTGGTSQTYGRIYTNTAARLESTSKDAHISVSITRQRTACGIAILCRNFSKVVGIRDCGHELGTAYNVTVTNVQLTSNVATVTYSGTDISGDFFTNMQVVIAGTSTSAGLFNGRWTATAVTSSTITFALTDTNISSTPDSGTASIHPATVS